MNGTVAQTLSSINRDYIYPIQLFFPNTYDYSSKTDISDSDLWGISLDNSRDGFSGGAQRALAAR